VGRDKLLSCGQTEQSKGIVGALPRFARPFALLHGVADPLPQDASRATVALVPHSVLVPIEDAGRFPWLEQPESVCAALRHALV
jgi:pimeloyl-ACP methyl ester carboxylesterase